MAWNGLVHSQKFLASVARNSAGHDVRLVLLDNGSTDGTRELFESVKPAALLTSPTNQSVYRGWNRMLEVALSMSPTPEMVVVANNDTVVGPGWLDAALRELRANPMRYFLPNGDFHPDTIDTQVASVNPPARTVPARAAWLFMMAPHAGHAGHAFLPLPEKLQLWYGDDIMHARLQAAGYACEAILDCCAAHVISATVNVRPDRDVVIAQDRAEYERLVEEMSR